MNMTRTKCVGLTVAVFGLIGMAWSAWVVFDGKNAWAKDVAQTTQQMAASTNGAILRVRLDLVKVKIQRLLGMQTRLLEEGKALTADDAEDLKLLRQERGIVMKGLEDLQKIEAAAAN